MSAALVRERRSMISHRSKRLVLLALSLVFVMYALPGQAWAHPAQAVPASIPLPDAEPVIGVVAEGLFAYPVLQQSKDHPLSVTSEPQSLTQFGLAAGFGNIGLLAHNYLAGASFFDLTTGQRVYLIFGAKRVEVFVITRILKFQALTPHSPYSEFRELEETSTITAAEMFRLAYGGSYHVTFQTCIEREGEKSWGRLFVIAEPLVDEK